MTIAIVAIPRDDDHVWKVSSEKVPHLTLLALGNEVGNLAGVVNYLGHIAETSLPKFGLGVDHRGVLGPDEADVLFFRKDGMKCLLDARADLLKNRDIFIAYNTSPQFPTWTPHLTLGFPSSPAKPDDREFPISWVSFDRIALWTGNFEGPEFKLKDDWFSGMEAAWSSLSVDGIQHHGIKGMHWGSRKSTIEGVSRSVSRDAKKDATEFARAKQFFGEGAGTRRKLIKAQVESKSKKDPAFKKAFDHHLANQDMEKHVSRAKSERKRKDVVKGTAKTARGVSHILRGNSQYASAAAAMLVGGAMFAHKKGIDAIVLKAGKTALAQARGTKIKAGMPASDFLRAMGVNP